MSNEWEREFVSYTPQSSHLSLVPETAQKPITPTDKEVGVFNLFERLNWLKVSSSFQEKPQLLSEETIDNGYIQRYGFITNLGYAYDAAVGIPNVLSTDIPAIQTSAWVTSSRGHNEHTLRRFVENGLPFIFVGPEGSYRPDGKYPIPKEGISLASSAAAVLNFTTEIASGYHYTLDQKKRILIGESRGAMAGMGMLALDELFGQDIVFADLTAPCFPRKAELKDLLGLSGHLISEPKSILKLAGKLGLSRLIHYPSTIDPHPYSIAHQIGMGPALFSGEAGDLARLITNDKIIHITCFDDDFASMPKVWREIFANHKNVRITPLEGSHLTIADPETLDYILARNHAFRNAHVAKKELDGQQIFNDAHNLISD